MNKTKLNFIEILLNLKLIELYSVVKMHKKKCLQ